MSICLWCDSCNRPYPDSDTDSQAMQIPIANIINGIKVGTSHTVERHRCGDCVRVERRVAEKRRELVAEEEGD